MFKTCIWYRRNILFVQKKTYFRTVLLNIHGDTLFQSNVESCGLVLMVSSPIVTPILWMLVA